MKSNVKNMLRVLSGLMLVLVMAAGAAIAQQPTPTPKKSDAKKAEPKAETTSAQTGEDAGDYTITSSIEFGYRGLRVDGDLNKYRSDLNYKAGPRLFDSSFLMRSKDGKGGLFDTLLVTSSGWGADPYGQMRILAEKPKWYRFEGSYRKFKYFRFLNNIANPNWIFSPTTFSRPPNPVTGEHGFNTRTQLGDFDLTILPKNETIRFTVGYSPERYSGPAYTSYHQGGNEFMFLSNLKSQANDFRLGADGKVGPIDFSFQQGFRRFRDDSSINLGATPGINLNPAVASFTTFNRTEPTRTSVNYTTFSVHSLVAKKLDLTARVVHSSSNSNFTFLENMTGTNFNTRIGSGAGAQLAPPNVLVLGQYNIPGNTKRPNTLGDFGATFLATDKLRISNTFRVETFEINGADLFNDIFTVSRGTTVDTRSFTNLSVSKITKYRKYQDTVEGDYQFNKNYSIHFGYRYGSRRIEQILSGFALNSNAPTALDPEDEVENNHTHAFFGGFKARPANNWTIYFDAEHGTADNVFTRIGNYNYTNIRAKSRYAPNRKINFNLAVITKDNSNPSEIAGVSLTDFGVNIKSRTFTSSVVWNPTAKLSFSTGYNYNWVYSDAVVDYFYQVPPAASVRHPIGHSLYFQRNNFFYLDAVAQIFPRVSLYASYRVNQDAGQGNRLADPTGTPGTLINSYPMSFQSPEARLAIRINRRLDWNLGYQYYNYNESAFVGPRPQNYHAHLPSTSLRLYFGRKE
ncbi:MAG TPA: hypothetical protein DCK93_04925 [Blastocatellia bacterium]|jgi:hypothetical protein|nr:hypothetical protein [Blastocatellia bacterium]HAF22248.1 hypothetical protein [Blastocatellia bacterium]